MNEIRLGNSRVSEADTPLIIAEIGINNEGDMTKARRQIEDAARIGCDCVKFECKIVEDEMIRNAVVPGNASESIWDIVNRCSFDESQERELKKYAESKGLIYLSTPFSRAAADRLEDMDVCAFKVG